MCCSNVAPRQLAAAQVLWSPRRRGRPCPPRCQRPEQGPGHVLQGLVPFAGRFWWYTEMCRSFWQWVQGFGWAVVFFFFFWGLVDSVRRSRCVNVYWWVVGVAPERISWFNRTTSTFVLMIRNVTCNETASWVRGNGLDVILFAAWGWEYRVGVGATQTVVCGTIRRCCTARVAR